MLVKFQITSKTKSSHIDWTSCFVYEISTQKKKSFHNEICITIKNQYKVEWYGFSSSVKIFLKKWTDTSMIYHRKFY